MASISGTPYASGFTNFGPTGTMNLIIPRYAKTVLRKLYPKTFAPMLASHDFEGEIKAFGASMTIRERSNVAGAPYKVGQMVRVSNLPNAPSFTFNINKSWAWAFPWNQVVNQQTDLKQYPAEMVDDALKNTATAIDTDFFTNVYSYSAAANAGSLAGAKSANINMGTPANPLNTSPDTTVNYIINARTCLKESNVTEVGNTWMVLPPAITGSCLTAQVLTAFNTGRALSPLVAEEGIDQDDTKKALGGFAGFDAIYESNLLYQGPKGEYYCPFGSSDGIQFAAQIGFAEEVPNQFDFGKIHRGLNVWGWGVSIPAMLGYLVLYPPTTGNAG